MRMIVLLAAIAVISGCTSAYVTPGGPARLDAIDRADIAKEIAREPAANFPAGLVVVRVQARDYQSASSNPVVGQRFSVLTSHELMAEDALEQLGNWDGVAGVAPISRLLLTDKLESLDDLRLAAARLRADVLMVYTLDTSFRIQGRGFGPLTALSLGLVPDRDALITSTATVLFTDVRTGYVYGAAEATARTSGLTSIWKSSELIDRKRIEAEQDAFRQLVPQARKTWTGITRRFSRQGSKSVNALLPAAVNKR